MPLNLPDKLPAIDILEGGKYFRHRQFTRQYAGYPSAENCYPQFDADKNNY